MQNFRVIVEDILRAVGVMCVSVYYCDALVRSVCMADVFHHDSFIVNKTEPARPVDYPHGVVAGRAEECKRSVGFAGHD